MLHSGKRAAVLTVAGLLTAGTLAGCSGSINTDAVVATVGNEDITLGVANFYARMTQGQYETYYAGMMGMTGEDMWAQEVEEGKTYEQAVKESIMTELENLYIIAQHAADYEVSLTEDEQGAIREAATQFDERNSDETKEAVSGYRKDIEKYLELFTIQNKMESKMKEGVDEEVSDEEAAQKAMKYVYFSFSSTDDSGNTVDLTDEEKEALRDDAQTLADRVKDGEDMTEVAEEMGLTVNDLTFDEESTGPNEDLVAEVDGFTEEGETTGPIESDLGIYVGQLTSLLDRDATDQEKNNIVEERRQEQYDSLLEEWRDGVKIEVDEKAWDKIDFNETGVTIITPEAQDGSDLSGTDESEDTQEGSESEDGSSADGSAEE
ncbi:MAG TPA: peptidyl-prolyl cis-trans isomerase [Candidatus Mediterraneibacter quadrami]|uniref:Peptidyl-prolyl cis-trans isomerase n=1 Tax=Candidatus Mediterraneibacter quadrami TaxID=2838684 RepID=A0A9D2RH23_9FIRM|nr:peptidyl-prolyl cis-trans isomerase [Candidatus Mediterraneibacter quadrami]